MTKCLVVLIDNANIVQEDKEKGFVITMRQLGEEIGKSAATARNTLEKLTQCKFEDIQVGKELEKKDFITPYGEKQKRITGTYIEINECIWFGE